MGVRRIIRKRWRVRRGGIDVAADVNATIAANTGGRTQRVRASSRQEATAGDAAAGFEHAAHEGRHRARSDPEDDPRR
jgi:hypothetical protein